MRQIQHYQFDARHCALFETRSRTTLVVARGRLWVTIEGERADHWLAAGDTLDVAARQRVWLGAQDTPARLRVLQDRTPRAMPAFAARLLAAVARFAGRHGENGRRNDTRCLNPGA